jgi:RNA polymerase sigma-70 factor (ECF subfamily)
MSDCPPDQRIASSATPRTAPGSPATLLPLVYDELRRLASRYLNREAPGNTLQPTALVHEAYMQLARRWPETPLDREQFLGFAAASMRRILVDHARRRGAEKRGGGRRREPMDDGLPAEDRDGFVVALDRALDRLVAIDPQQGRLVELRFFGGLTVEEIARVLGVSTRTVDREWLIAKGWLHREISREE